MALTINDLGIVQAAVFEARTKWYNIGLALNVPVGTLDSIKLDGQFGDHGDKLRETLKVWLKTATRPTWQDVVDVLKSPVVAEPKLASDIEAKHCTTAETGQASGHMMPAVEPTTTTDTQLRILEQALQENRELRTKDQESQTHIHTLQLQLQDSQRQIEELTRQVEEKNQQLQTIKQDLLQREQTNQELKRQLQQVNDKQTAAEERERQLLELNKQLRVMKRAPMEQKTMEDMRWQEGPKVLERIRRGSVASDSNVAYFNGNGSHRVHSYDFDTQLWHELPCTPHTHFTLVVVQHVLTMLGGELESGEPTDSLLSLMGEGRDKKWLPNFPAMPTKRLCAAAVCSGCSLIVAGGRDDCYALTTVEVLDTYTRQWSVASSLKHPFTSASLSICGERLYMLGGMKRRHTSGSHCAISCSVLELIQSCQVESQRMAGRWQSEADTPHSYSSCATLCGQLVAVGGEQYDEDTTCTFYLYNERTKSWKAMGDMPTARRYPLVAIVNGKMIVVGGLVKVRGRWTATDAVEILC